MGGNDVDEVGVDLPERRKGSRLFVRNYAHTRRTAIRSQDAINDPGYNESDALNRPYLVNAASTRKAQPTIPKSKLTIQNLRFFVSAEIAAMAIAIWNMVTPRAKTSCL